MMTINIIKVVTNQSSTWGYQASCSERSMAHLSPLCNSVRLDVIIITLSFQLGNWSGLGVRLWGQDKDPGHLVAPCAHSHHPAPQELLISGD